MTWLNLNIILIIFFILLTIFLDKSENSKNEPEYTSHKSIEPTGWQFTLKWIISGVAGSLCLSAFIFLADANLLKGNGHPENHTLISFLAVSTIQVKLLKRYISNTKMWGYSYLITLALLLFIPAEIKRDLFIGYGPGFLLILLAPTTLQWLFTLREKIKYSFIWPIASCLLYFLLFPIFFSKEMAYLIFAAFSFIPNIPFSYETSLTISCFLIFFVGEAVRSQVIKWLLCRNIQMAGEA